MGQCFVLEQDEPGELSARHRPPSRARHPAPAAGQAFVRRAVCQRRPRDHFSSIARTSTAMRKSSASGSAKPGGPCALPPWKGPASDTGPWLEDWGALSRLERGVLRQRSHFVVSSHALRLAGRLALEVARATRCWCSSEVSLGRAPHFHRLCRKPKRKPPRGWSPGEKLYSTDGSWCQVFITSIWIDTIDRQV